MKIDDLYNERFFSGKLPPRAYHYVIISLLDDFEVVIVVLLGDFHLGFGRRE